MARCSLCGEPAVAYVRYQRRYFCSKHFIEFFEGKVGSTIRRYGMLGEGDLVLVAVSGGKDSAALLGVLQSLREEFKYDLIALHIDLGIGEYSRRSRESAVKLAEYLGVPALVIDLKEVLGAGIPELSRKSRRPPCSVCGLVKRYVINAAAVELGASKVALGHNADDLLSYSMKSFINQDLEAISKLGPKTESLSEVAVGRVRPLYEVYEKEAFLYAYLRGLPFIHDECPNVDLRSLERELKGAVIKLEEGRPGIKLSMLRKLARRLRDYPSPGGEVRKCRYCGLMTSGDVCSFCRLTERALGEPKGVRIREYVRGRREELVVAKPT